MADKPEAFPTDADIDDVLAEFGGDHRAAIGALLKNLAALAGDYGAERGLDVFSSDKRGECAACALTTIGHIHRVQ